MPQNQIFTEAFVEEVIVEISVDDLTAREDLDVSISKELILKAPHNSAIIRNLTDGEEKTQVIAYPLFPSHMLMPINTGDHVWTLQLGGQIYWITRKNYSSVVEDLSVVYPERAEGPISSSDDTAEQHSRANTGENILPRTLSTVKSVYKDDEDEYINILKDKRKIVSEVVPRFKKRPGDLVFQGSNNTLISLGTDRGFKTEDEIDLTTPSSALDTPAQYSGTIDLVTGRGRYLPATATTAAALGDIPFRTAPPIIVNDMGEQEVHKDPISNEIPENINKSEGDPDFGFDASRIYISSKTKVDENFSLIKNYPPIPAVITEEKGVVPEPIDAAAITIKSDELRLIARKHIAADSFSAANTTAADVNGSIKIIKEGNRDADLHSTTDGEGAAVIALQPDGTIMIDGATIVIGTGRENSNGSGDQVYIGAGATEPIVLGNALKSILDGFFTDLTTFLSAKYDTHFHPTGVGPSGPPTVVGDDAGSGTAQSKLDEFLSKVGKTL
tara:strand:+ start:3732 stop:5234 length:1503 start_codon:yes stop_codon:yes gene_type:complete